MVSVKSKKIKILHIIKWFYAGGAERLFSSYIEHSDKDKFEHIVISLSDQNERIIEIKDKFNIEYHSFDMKNKKLNFSENLKCFNLIKEINPDIIKTWLPPANIKGAIIGKLLGKTVIWGLHDSQPKREHDKRHVFVSKYCVNKIICCSDAVQELCVKLGYEDKKINVINNGTDTNKFKYSKDGRKKIRAEIGIDDNTTLIGVAAEYSLVKRYKNFLEAAKLHLNKYPKTKFLLCGRNVEYQNKNLALHLKIIDIENNVVCLGIRDDMPEIFSAMDINTLNSEHESFGLSMTEALSCEVLCVGTRTGVLPKILENVGEVIEVSGNPKILADAWDKIVNLSNEEKSRRKELGRERIEKDYSIKTTAHKYDELFIDTYNNFY